MEMKVARIWRPLRYVYIKNGFVMDVDKNAHETRPAPYQNADLILPSGESEVCDCEKYVTRAPKHWHCVTLGEFEMQNVIWTIGQKSPSYIVHTQ